MAHRLSRAAWPQSSSQSSRWPPRAQCPELWAPGWASPEPNRYAMPTGAEGLTAAMSLCPGPRRHSPARRTSPTARSRRRSSCTCTTILRHLPRQRPVDDHFGRMTDIASLLHPTLRNMSPDCTRRRRELRDVRFVLRKTA